MFVFFGLGVQHVFHRGRLFYGRYRYRKYMKLKKKTPLSEVLKRFSAIHTPNYKWKGKQKKQVTITKLQDVAEEPSYLEEIK
jgi:hypothetical protein